HNLRYVVVDEAHVYRGVFGSHVGNVLRRLRRLAKVYGADPQFLFASATIANPCELVEMLSGLEATVIADDAAPRAERTVALWNPELLDEELGLRASPLGDGSRPTVPATPRSSGATSSGVWSPGSSSASRPRTHSSSESTSACSTRRSAS